MNKHLKKHVNKLNKIPAIKLFTAVLLAAVIFIPESAMATSTLTSLSTTMTGSSKVVVTATTVISALVGFMLALAGINGIVQAKKRQEGMGAPVVTLVIGAALMSAAAMASVTSSTLFSTNSTGMTAIGLIQ